MTKFVMLLLLIPVYIIIGVCWFFVTMFIAVRGLVEIIVDYLVEVRK